METILNYKLSLFQFHCFEFDIVIMYVFKIFHCLLFKFHFLIYLFIHVHFFLDLIFLFFAVCLYLSFGLSEDDAYVDKLPTFERHFDSFAGIVTIPLRVREGVWLGKGLLNGSFVSFQSVLCF